MGYASMEGSPTPMTVCIAALYENGKGAVLASDHMITASIPIGYEFENEETSKIIQLTDDSYALFAGNVLYGDQIMQASIESIAANGHSTIKGIAEEVKSSYATFRRTFVEERYLAPRGLTLESYYSQQSNLNSRIVEEIDQALSNIDLGVECIVVGPTISGYGICTVRNPGVAVRNDVVGFSAIGSGAPHVLYSLLGATYRKALGKVEVTELIARAKAMSEVAPGVGKQTSIKVLPLDELGDDDETS